MTNMIENDLHSIDLTTFDGTLVQVSISKMGATNNSTKLAKSVVKQYGKPVFDGYEPYLGDYYRARFKFKNTDANVNVFAWIGPVEKSTINTYGFIQDAIDSVDYVCAKRFAEYQTYLNLSKKPQAKPNVSF